MSVPKHLKFPRLAFGGVKKESCTWNVPSPLVRKFNEHCYKFLVQYADKDIIDEYNDIMKFVTKNRHTKVEQKPIEEEKKWYDVF